MRSWVIILFFDYLLYTMDKIEFLAASLSYDLCVEFKGSSGNITGYDLLNEKLYFMYERRYEKSMFLKDVVPIIRQFSDLYKECVQANYNNGKTFVPIIELAKIAYDEDWTLSTDCYCAISYHRALFYIYDNWSFIYSHEYSGDEVPPKQFELYQQLIKWHFWPYMKEDENVMYVTDGFNPYK